MNYVVYTPLGEITKSGVCQPDTLARQAVEDGEVAMEGYGGDMTHYVDLTGPEPVIREVP